MRTKLPDYTIGFAALIQIVIQSIDKYKEVCVSRYKSGSKETNIDLQAIVLHT